MKKRPIKKNSLRLLFLYIILTGFISSTNTDKDAIDPEEGFIDIIVESNINKLSFKYDFSDKCLYIPDNNATIINNDTSSTKIMIPVKEFKCTNNIAYNDFLELLKANIYPNLTVIVPQKSLMFLKRKTPSILQNVLIDIAGISKQYDIKCSIINDEKTAVNLVGTTTVKLSDLNIDPPVKYFGLIKIKDDITIKFVFCLRNYNPYNQVSDLDNSTDLY